MKPTIIALNLVVVNSSDGNKVGSVRNPKLDAVDRLYSCIVDNLLHDLFQFAFGDCNDAKNALSHIKTGSVSPKNWD
jgi:hypothetical protein